MTFTEALQNDIANHPSPELAIATSCVFVLVLTAVGGLTMKLSLAICGAGSFGYVRSLLAAVVASVLVSVSLAGLVIVGSPPFLGLAIAFTAGALGVCVVVRADGKACGRAFGVHCVLNFALLCVVLMPIAMVAKANRESSVDDPLNVSPVSAPVHGAKAADGSSNNPFFQE